ncbi:MAG TPA: hypothetical protein VFI96_07685 [Longimicrobiaceae bacterium]|nr:hypothetical protein [Longimicrobiaceae bacterium]
MTMKRRYLIALMAGALVVGGCDTKTGVAHDTEDQAVVPPGAIPADPNASLVHPTVPKDQPTTAAAPAATPDSAPAPADSTPAGA